MVAFIGKPHGHGHESPMIMLAPLLVLAILSITGGYLAIPQFLGQAPERLHSQFVPIVSVIAVAVGFLLAWLIYNRRAVSAQGITMALATPYKLLKNRYYIDDLYTWYVVNIQQKIISGACAWFERNIIIGVMVNGTAALTRTMGFVVRLCQTGRVQTYVLGFLLGVLWLLGVHAKP